MCKLNNFPWWVKGILRIELRIYMYAWTAHVIIIFRWNWFGAIWIPKIYANMLLSLTNIVNLVRSYPKISFISGTSISKD